MREAIRQGRLDTRALVLLAGLTGSGPVTVVELPVVPGETAAVPLHQLTLAQPVDATTQGWLRIQLPPFAPVVTSTATGVVLSWPVPSTLPD